MSRTLKIWALLICGFLVIGYGLGMDTGGIPVRAQDEPEEADYAGVRECSSCHRGLARDHEETLHGQALLDVSDNKDLILGDFGQSEDIRTVQFPGESEPRPFTEDDIVYAVGAGRYAQRYVYELGDDEYAVLPAEWSAVTNTWQPLELAATWPDPAYDWLQNCAGCHTTGLDVSRARWEDDGVQCEACHGPGSIHIEVADEAGRSLDEDELAQIHGAIVLSPDAQICGQCHSRGIEPEGQHPYPVNYRPGSDLLHEEVFALAAADDSVAWWETGHAHQNNMQFNEWLTSAHASSLDTLKSSADAQDGCLQCHSGDNALFERLTFLYDEGELEAPPEPVTVETAQFSVTCITCHSPHLAQQPDFILADEPYNLCTSCHQNTTLTETVHHPVKEMFEGQTIVENIEGIPSAHFADENGPRCVTCHMTRVPTSGFDLGNHTWRPVLPGAAANSPPDSCSGCHEDLTTADLQSLILDTQETIRSRLATTWARVASIQQPEPGTEASQLYEQAVAALTFVQNDGSQGVHNFAYADALLDTVSGMLVQVSVPGARLQPTEAPAPTVIASAPQEVTVSEESPIPTGVRPMTIIIVSAVVLILLIGALIFIRQSKTQEA